MKMRKLFFIFFISLNSFSQQQWKFYVAFEDATGAKDSLWMVYDTSATFNIVDAALGEGSVPMDHSKFNVWIYNANFDSTKTEANPYISFPHHALNNIRAFNYQYPILISWDTSLFHSSVLPSQITNYINDATIDNDYFFFVNNDPLLHKYNMIITDSAIAPTFSWASQDHFPMTILLSYTSVGIGDLEIKNIKPKISPNPSVNSISISYQIPISKIIIMNALGIQEKEIICSIMKSENNILVNIDDLAPGIYYCIFYIDNQNFNYQHFIKSN